MTRRLQSPSPSPSPSPRPVEQSPSGSDSNTVSPSPPRRGNSVRISSSAGPKVGSSSTASLRVLNPINSVGRGRQPTSNSSFNVEARVRRPTPAVRRRPINSDHNYHYHDDCESRPPARQATVSMSTNMGSHSGRNNRSSGNMSLRLDADRCGARNGGIVSWFERILPEFVYNITSPITGYESRLDYGTEIDDYEWEILERDRLRRNKKIRRRLATLLLIATAASVFMYAKGRLVRRVGVKAAASSLKHRIEDGIAKSIHDTLGK